MYNLLYDEMNDLITIYNTTEDKIYTESKWAEVNNYDDFVRIINENGLPELISFGKDISDNMVDSFFFQQQKKSGYDCVLWLIDYCKNNNKPFPKYIIHSNDKDIAIKKLLENL